MTWKTDTNDLGAVQPAAEYVDSVFREGGAAQGLCHDAHVCLEEALANLIIHGRTHHTAKAIEVSAEASQLEIILRIRDNCVPFDSVTHSVAANSSGEMRIGGNGLRLMRALTKDMAYTSSEGWNELRLTLRQEAPKAPTDIMRRIPVFSETSNEALLAMLESGKHQRHQAGDKIITQGNIADHAVILLSGAAEILSENAHGNTVVARVEAPALIGEIGALTGAKRTASVRASEPIEILRVGREAFLRCAQDAPELLVRVIAQLGLQIQNINQALGFFSAGLGALERDDFDPAIMDALNSPTHEMMAFAEAFKGLAKRVIQERKTRDEMASAAIIQRAMLPAPVAPELLRGKASVFGDMKPARNVGGDLYDVFLMEDGRLAIVIGDVCGKGVPASLFMSVTVTALRVAAQATQRIDELVARANNALCSHNDAGMFSTLFYGALSLDTGRLEYVNCGHNPPFGFDAAGVTMQLEGRGPPLGFFPGKRWPVRVAHVPERGGVLLYTDGVTEAVDPSGVEFGDTALTALIGASQPSTAQALVQTIVSRVEEFAGGSEQFDDITCLAAIRS